MVLLGSIQRRYLMKRLMDEKGTWDESAVASGAATPSAAEVIEETDNPTRYLGENSSILTCYSLANRPATLRVESDESQQNADEVLHILNINICAFLFLRRPFHLNPNRHRERRRH